MLPVSRCPRVREPIYEIMPSLPLFLYPIRNRRPSCDRLDELRYERWNVAAIAIEKHYDVIPHCGTETARAPAAHARP